MILTPRGSPKSVGKKGVKTGSSSVSTSNIDSIMDEFGAMEIVDESHSTVESTSDTQLALQAEVPCFQDKPQNAEEATCLDEFSSQNKELKKHIKTVTDQFSEYVALSEKIIGKQSYIIELYHHIVTNGGTLGGLLSLSERCEITNEIKKVRGIFNLGIRIRKLKILCQFLNQHFLIP
ncbi:Hypothetical predicted protein [Paramuricea clavata]|uniref:Uncharacterized protein n=1 Tax=Paramuricea clavata TaxID=317549 RepID=A0A6S7JBC8_PARCT|nr:Hypothetical predicted protein [Paramuricea clavata]